MKRRGRRGGSKRVVPRRRNAYAVVARRLGHRIKPSGKLYRRRSKHKDKHDPRDNSGGSILRLGVDARP